MTLPTAPLTAPPLLVIIALPALDLRTNSVPPPLAPLTAPPLLVMLPLPAVLPSSKNITPPLAPLTVPPLFVKVPLPAVEVPKNSITPLTPPLAIAALLVKMVEVPAVALFVNRIRPLILPHPQTAVTKFCATPELFVMPAPLRLNMDPSMDDALAVIVNALAPALNTMPLTSVMAERETLVVLEKANVAVSEGPLGTVAGIQLRAVFQSPLAGFRSRSRCRLGQGRSE